MKSVRIEVIGETAIFYCAKCKEEIARGFYMGVTVPECCPNCGAVIVEDDEE